MDFIEAFEVLKEVFVYLINFAFMPIIISILSNYFIAYMPLRKVRLYIREKYQQPIASVVDNDTIIIQFIVSFINSKGVNYSFSNIECYILTKDKKIIYCDYLHKEKDIIPPQSEIVNAHSSAEREFCYGTKSSTLKVEDLDKIFIVFKDYKGKDKYCVLKDCDFLEYTIKKFKEIKITKTININYD